MPVGAEYYQTNGRKDVSKAHTQTVMPSTFEEVGFLEPHAKIGIFCDNNEKGTVVVNAFNSGNLEMVWYRDDVDQEGVQIDLDCYVEISGAEELAIRYRKGRHLKEVYVFIDPKDDSDNARELPQDTRPLAKV